MSSLYFGRRKPYNKYALLTYQKSLVNTSFPYLKCSIRNNVLACIGVIQLPHCRQSYKIKIEYIAGHEPKSTILSPFIEPNKDIHMYPDHSLCLHYPPDMPWSEKIRISEYTIPWISEWIVYYEIYLINGNIWEGPVSPAHFTINDINLNKDDQ